MKSEITEPISTKCYETKKPTISGLIVHLHPRNVHEKTLSLLNQYVKTSYGEFMTFVALTPNLMDLHFNFCFIFANFLKFNNK